MACLYLGLGCNLGHRESSLKQAIEEIEKSIGSIVAQSAFYDTPAWGFASDHLFLNACLTVETLFSVRECLKKTQEIERKMGRTQKTVNGCYHDRIIDIDILFYDQEIIDEKDLKVPHPLIQERRFVLEPIVEIAPNFVHPVLHKTCKQLLLSLT